MEISTQFLAGISLLKFFISGYAISLLIALGFEETTSIISYACIIYWLTLIIMLFSTSATNFSDSFLFLLPSRCCRIAIVLLSYKVFICLMPLPPFDLPTYKRSTSLFGWKLFITVNVFLAFISS